MKQNDLSSSEQVFGPKATYADVSNDLLSEKNAYDVLYSDSLDKPVQFRFFRDDLDSACSFAKEQKFSLVVSHSIMKISPSDE